MGRVWRQPRRFWPAAARNEPSKPAEVMTMDDNTLTPAATLARAAKTPFPGESTDYRKAREALLAEEIEFRRHMTRLAAQRRALPPGPVIAKNYRFKDANGAEIGLKDLFASMTRWSPISGCTARSASAPARCAPIGWARSTATP